MCMSDSGAQLSHPSQILLVLLSIGEAYIVDLRKEHRGRFELFEPQDDDMDGEQGKQRCVLGWSILETSLGIQPLDSC